MTDEEMHSCFLGNIRVHVASEDHTFSGLIIMIGFKRDGVKMRCVIENDDGVLHVHKSKHLELETPDPLREWGKAG